MSPPTCAHCNASLPNLKRCVHCRVASYCDKACQKADWKSHKTICKPELEVGDIVDFAIPVVDPSKPRKYPTFDELFEATGGNIGTMKLPPECYSTRRRADGSIMVFISEDKWQEYQAREAEKKAAKPAEMEVMHEESVPDGGDEKGEKE